MKSIIVAFLAVLISNSVHAEIVANNLAEEGFVSTGWATSIGYSNPSNGYTNEGAGQEFIPSETSILTTISATVSPFIGGQPLIVSLYTANAGSPSLFVGSIQVPEEDISGTFNIFDFSHLNILLIKNQPYIVTFTVSNPVGITTSYRAHLTAANENSFGIRSLISKDSFNWAPLNVDPEIGLIVEANLLTPPPLEISIKILTAKVNLKSKNPKPLEVAVLGSESLDVNQIEVGRILFGDPVLTDPELGIGTPVFYDSVAYEDINGDGVLDLVVTFSVAEMKALDAIDQQSTDMLLEARLSNGRMIYGSAPVTLNGVGKAKGKKK